MHGDGTGCFVRGRVAIVVHVCNWMNTICPNPTNIGKTVAPMGIFPVAHQMVLRGNEWSLPGSSAMRDLHTIGRGDKLAMPMTSCVILNGEFGLGFFSICACRHFCTCAT